MDKDVEKLINDIVWWIPFKNKRNKLRNSLIEKIDNDTTTTNNNYDKLNIILGSINKILELTTITNSKDIKKNILKRNLRLIEIEISSYCNRKCWFCPNSFIDRNSNNFILDEKIYLKILDNLSDIKYDKAITFHRFNEPLYDRQLLLKRISQAKEKIPNAKLHIYTNGDYLTREYLDELKEAGLNYIMISFYVKNGQNYDVNKFIQPGIDKISEKLGLNYSIVENSIRQFQVKFNYDGMELYAYSMNWIEMAGDRGGIIKNVKIENERRYPCFYPFRNLYIDYNGFVMPCCNLRSDVDSHKSYILGDVNKKDLFDIFMDQEIINLRQYLGTNLLKEGACKHCHYKSEGYMLYE